jgi:hypothetical protein
MAAKGGGLMLLLDKPKKGKKDEDDDLDLGMDDDVPEDLEDDAPKGGAFESYAETALGTGDPEKISAFKEAILACLEEHEDGGKY